MPKTQLTREERYGLCKILKTYISRSEYDPLIREGLRIVVNDYEAYGTPDDPKEFRLLKDLIDEVMGV